MYVLVNNKFMPTTAVNNKRTFEMFSALVFVGLCHCVCDIFFSSAELFCQLSAIAV